MTDLRIGSLCTGYGGLTTAVQQVVGGDVVWHADKDPGASALLARHHPTIPNLGDITTVDWATVPPVDILEGGYPCQPFSAAGKRKGTDDDRHLWPHIAHAIDALRPRLVVLENVRGHLSLGFAAVLADLARLGFDAEWCCVAASEVGAAHRRDRLFVVAWPASADTEDVGQHRPGPARDGRAGSADRGVTAADAVRLAPRDDGELPAGRDAVRQRVRTDAPRCGAAAADTAGDGRGEGRPEPARQQGRLDVALGGGPTAFVWGEYEAAIRRWEHVFGSDAPRAVDDSRRLDAPFVEWLMGVPAGHVTATAGVSRTAQLRLLGNGVVPQQATYALRLLLDRAPEALPALPALDPARST